MLPSGLLRAKVVQRTIAPAFVNVDKPAIVAAAQAVFKLFAEAAAKGERIGVVDQELAAFCQERRDHRMVRGLAHLARARCTLQEPSASAEPKELRDEVFKLAVQRGPLSLDGAALAGPTATQVLSEVAVRRGMAPEEVADTLYADLESERRVRALDVPDPAWLLDRYNVALVQTLLGRATAVTVLLREPTTPRLRQLFRFVKFHQLLHRVESTDEGLTVVLDGPMSLFRGSTRYGRQLGRFFPALCLQDGPWTLTATVLWTKANHKKQLKLTSEQGLKSHLADTGAYWSKPAAYLRERFTDTKTDWTLHDATAPVRLGARELVFPDFRAAQGDREAHLEILGHWREDALERRLQALDRYGPQNIVFAVSKRLAGGKGPQVPEHPNVLPFSEVLPPKKVIEALDRVAIPVRDSP